MQNRRRLALAGIGLLAFGASVVQVVFSDRVVKSFIHDLLATSVGAPVRIQDVQVSFEKGLEVTGLEVLDPTHPTQRTILTVERAALDFRLGLFGHGPRIDSIELDGTTVRLSRRPDGTFPISTALTLDRRDAPQDTGPGPPPPDIRIRSGRLTYSDPEFLADGRTITIENISGGLSRDPPGLPSFMPQPHLVKISGDADIVGRVTIDGVLNPYVDPHRFDVALERIVVDDSISAWLAPKYAEVLRNLSPRGEIRLSLHATGRTVADTHVEARLDLTDVGCSVQLPNADTANGPHPDYDGRKLDPVVIDGISGQVVVNGDEARIDGVAGRFLGASFSLSGAAQGVRSNPGELELDVVAQIDGLHVSRGLADRLPYSVIRVIEAYGLDVHADALVELSGTTIDPVVRARADVRKGRASYRGYVWKDLGKRRGFPWTVDIDRGHVLFDQSRDGLLEIVAHGHHGPTTVKVTGEVTHPTDRPSRASVKIMAQDAELGPDLRAGFEDRADKMFDRWSPTGVAQRIDVHVYNEPDVDGDATETDVEITFDGRATFRPRELPTPLTILSGKVLVLRPVRNGRRIDEVRIENIVAQGEGFQLNRVAGAFTGSGDDAEERLLIEGTSADVGRALRDALQRASILQPAVKDSLRKIHPGGAMDFAVRLDRHAGVRDDHVSVTLKNGSIEGFADVSLPATGLSGVVTVQNDEIALGNVKGTVFGSPVRVDGRLIGAESVPSLDIDATDLALGPKLRKALGPIGERAAPFFDILEPTDATFADVSVKVRPPDDPDGEVRMSLTRLRGPVRPLELPYTVTDGAIDYDGKRVTARAKGRIGAAEVEFRSVDVPLDTEHVQAKVSARRLRFPEDLAGLLSADAVSALGELAPGRLLHSPELDVTWDPSTRRLTLRGDTSLQRAELPAGADRGLDLVGLLRLQPLHLTFPAEGGTLFGGRVQAEGLSLTPGLELTDFNGTADVEGASGSTVADAEGTRFTLDVRDARFEALDRKAREASFALSFVNGVTLVNELKAKLHGGALTGRIVASAPGFRYRGHLNLVDASAERVLGVAPERNMGGRMDLNLAFRNPDGARRSLRGEGDGLIVEANLAEIPLITAFSGPFEVGAFTETNAEFKIEGQRILIEDANVEGNLLSVRAGSGSVDLDGDRSIDLVATVHAGPSGVGPLELLWKAIGNTILRVRVTGTLRNPRPQGQFFGFLGDLFGSDDRKGPGPRPVDPPEPPTRYPW